MARPKMYLDELIARAVRISSRCRCFRQAARRRPTEVSRYINEHRGRLGVEPIYDPGRVGVRLPRLVSPHAQVSTDPEALQLTLLGAVCPPSTGGQRVRKAWPSLGRDLLPIWSRQVHQLVVRPVLHDPSTFHHQDEVSVDDRAHPVSDHDSRAAEFAEGPVHRAFGDAVEVTRSLVE